MTIARNRLALAAAVGTLLAGCSTAPRFNEHFGASVRANLSAQVLDPAAAAHTDPVLGVDGNAARATQERYQRSFKESDSRDDRPLIGGGTGGTQQ